MLRRIILFPLLLLVFVNVSLRPGDSYGQQANKGGGQAVIKGRVVDTDNKPVDGIEVKAFRGVERVATYRTKNDGQYELRFNPGGQISVVLYGGVEYCPCSIFNVSGQTEHSITKVIYRRNPTVPCKSHEEVSATLKYIDANPEMFPEERQQYASLINEIVPEGSQRFAESSASALPGTYRLNTTQGDNARDVVERATRTLPHRNREQVLDSLIARLESPDHLAIDQRRQTITIATTRSPQFTFEADGREISEQTADGGHTRVRATLKGDQLVVSSTGDRFGDFSVTFDSIENGHRLRVTRRITDRNLTSPVVVQSTYDKISEVARFDVYTGPQHYPTATNSSGDFVIPEGTQVVAVLNKDLTTKEARENDPFTLTVRSPYQYEGAIINGYVSNVSRSGRITGRSEMTLNFESITLRDGRGYRFAGIVETVRAAGGETVRVDSEGSVRDNNRTTTTAQRAGIGGAVGAIIGAIAGGGKGASIGAIVGAGAGAGSVYVQGKDDLEITSGAEVTIRSSSPNVR